MRLLAAILSIVALLAMAAPGRAADFSFHTIKTLDAMAASLKRAFPLGSDRAALHATFDGAGAKRYKHPDLAGVEKWVYDINLCKFYVWRWNISANFDAAGALTQLFVNGEPVHARGDKPRDVQAIAASNGKQQAIYHGSLPRPEASEGDNVLAFLMFDVDTNSRKASDEFVTGAGPSRADPANLGRMHAYTTELWRSIFDGDRARSIAAYAGECPARS
ncbi:MAG: hypothetical protein EOP22_14600 [Hyphomicrobiales bacterium]|nr:MAG: hypothetical protein EOP22_14600 [Hyphomicrobiales bacterium]